MPLFDPQELLDRVDHDWDFLADTVQMLENDGRALMDEIRYAAATGDAPGLGRAGHALKGMISNFCAPDAQASAMEVERLGKSGDLTTAPEAIETLSVRLEELIAGLTDFLTTRAS